MSSLFLTSVDMTAATPSGTEANRGLASPTAGTGGAFHTNKNSVAGPTAPLKVTDGAAGTDGNVIAWYSNRLQAVTIAGQIVCNLWDRENAVANNVAGCVGIWETDLDGAELFQIVNPATSQAGLELATTAGGVSDVITVTAANVIDRAVSAGNRLKIALFIDDASGQGGSGSMATGGRGEFWVNAATGVQGQSEINFTETLVTFNPNIVAGQRLVRQAVKRSFSW